MIVVQVILPIPINKSFKYRMHRSMQPIIGGRVLVPFRSKEMIGIVISFLKENAAEQSKLLYVKKVIDLNSLYTDCLIKMLLWIVKYYYFPIGNLFFSILPKLMRNDQIIQKKYFIHQWKITEKGKNIDLYTLKNRKKQCYVLSFLKKKSVFNTELKKYKLSKLILKTLEMQNLCKLHVSNKNSVKRKNFFSVKRNFFLNKNILHYINKNILKKEYSQWLFTKTHLYSKIKFYLGLIQLTLMRNMQILILVPYLKQINVIVLFLKKFFNVVINVFHAQITSIQQLKIWMNTKNGENSIIVGTKKSVFLPFLKLGAIVVIEEHDLQYKNQTQYTYNFKDFGILRAYKENIPVILDTDTPSLKSLYNISFKKCRYININKNKKIVHINSNLINLKKEKIQLRLSNTLIHVINNYIKTKQVLLVFNKFHVLVFFLSCKICGWILTCDHCKNNVEIYKQHDHSLFCFVCLRKIHKPEFCYHCGHLNLTFHCMKIQDMKNKIKNMFPNTPIFFLFEKKHFNKKIFNLKKYEFFFSTPAIILISEKFLQHYYFPFVRLIGLINIDHCIASFKFCSIEHFMQYYLNLTKITKFSKNTQIIMQTYHVHDENIKNLLRIEYFSFALQELQNRKKFFLPPYTFQVNICSQSMYYEENILFLNLIRKILEDQSKNYNIYLFFFKINSIFLHNSKKKYFHKLSIQVSSRIIFNKILQKSLKIINFFYIARKVAWFIDVDSH